MPVYSDTKWEWQKHFCFTSESEDGLGYNGFAVSGIDLSILRLVIWNKFTI